MTNHVHLRVLAFALSLVASPLAVLAQSRLLPETALRQYGLKSQWVTRVNVDPSFGGIVHITPHVSSTRATTFYEVQDAGRTLMHAESDLDRFGKTVGSARAAEQAARDMVRLIRIRRITKHSDEQAAQLDALEKAAQQVIKSGQDYRTLQFYFQRIKSAGAARFTVDTIAKIEKISPEVMQVMKEPLEKSTEWEVDAVQDLINSQEIGDPLLKASQSAPADLPKLVKHVVPETTLYVTTKSGWVHALDAETGKTRWVSQVGTRNYPTTGAGVNEDFVAVANGSTLYVLSAIDGSTAWERTLRSASMVAPSLSDKYVIAPTFSGQLQVFNVKDPKDSYSYISHGRATTQPLVTNESVVWTTSRNHLYAANVENRGVRYRLETGSAVSAAPGYFASPSLPRLLTASQAGYIFCIQAMSGQVLWRLTTGLPITQSPLVFGDQTYVTTDGGDVLCIGIETGEISWTANGVSQLLSASDDRLYGVGDFGRLMILDRETGATIAQMQAGLSDLQLVNRVTDRIYVGTRAGSLQCLRELKTDWPLVHISVEAPEETKDDEKSDTSGTASPAAGEASPFGGEANPFGDTGGDNPFGGGAAGGGDNPFGGGGGDNPFGGGGGDNPFGGDTSGDNPFDN